MSLSKKNRKLIQKYESRYSRAKNDNLSLLKYIEPKEEDNKTKSKKSKNKNYRDFIVLGSTGNEYKVRIQKEPTCTCPDYIMRGNRCKHILFILENIFDEYQSGENYYDEVDVDFMFDEIPERIKLMYEKNLNIEKRKNMDFALSNINNDEICPICFQKIKNGKKIDKCLFGCGQEIHFDCLNKWHKFHNIKNCPYCKVHWFPIKKQKGYYDDEDNESDNDND